MSLKKLYRFYFQLELEDFSVGENKFKKIPEITVHKRRIRSGEIKTTRKPHKSIYMSLKNTSKFSNSGA